MVAGLLLLAACGGSEHAALAQETQPARSSVQDQLGAHPTAAIDTATAAALSTTFRNAAARALSSVVYVQVEERPDVAMQRLRQQHQAIPFFDPQQQQELPPVRGSGSGFIFDSRGYILTNNHVVADAQKVKVTTVNGREYDATVVGTDPNSDVAVIKIEPPQGVQLQSVRFGDSDQLKVGDWVLALGNPLGLQFTVTAGIVSAKGRNLGILAQRQQNNATIESYIQTDAAINPGNSGGPLVNLMGEVVGINSAIESETGFNVGYGFAIPIDLAQKVAQDLIKYGTVRRPQLGVLIGPVSDVEAELYHLPKVEGALVTQVQPNTPADRAGVKMGDVITALNGEPIQSSPDLIARLARMQPGSSVSLTVYRGGKPQQLSVKLGQFEQPKTREQVAEKPQRGRDLLGFEAQDLTPAIARQLGVDRTSGAVVSDVARFGPAAQRITRGTIVLSINGQQVGSASDVDRISAGLDAGQPVQLVVIAPGSDQPQLVTYRASE